MKIGEKLRFLRENDKMSERSSSSFGRTGNGLTSLFRNSITDPPRKDSVILVRNAISLSDNVVHACHETTNATRDNDVSICVRRLRNVSDSPKQRQNTAGGCGARSRHVVIDDQSLKVHV